MTLKEKLARTHSGLKECCCGNVGCGGSAQESAFLAGFEAAKCLILERDPPFVRPDGTKYYYYIEHPASYFRDLGDEKI